MNDSHLLFETLVENPNIHAPGTKLYRFLQSIVREKIVEQFSETTEQSVHFEPFGELIFPFHAMGAINSLDLFGLDELIIFAYYSKNRMNYRNVADIGANLGLHSIILGRCGFNVQSYEPDPVHLEVLRRNLNLNKITQAQINEAAVSTLDGEAEFVRVLGNTTGSHLVGAKSSYGEKETFRVAVKAVQPIFEWADLIKMDAEGHEAAMICSSRKEDWDGTDMIVEVGSPENAKQIFQHLRSLGINMFAQKVGWQKVASAEDMPASHRDGSLFISKKPAMVW